MSTTIAHSTLVIFLGAHEWPQWPELGSSKAFSRSALGLRRYLLDDAGFGLPEVHLLDLFDTEKGPNDIDIEISDFLEKRVKQGGESGLPVENLLVFYIGHGGFVDSNKEFFLAVRATREKNPGLSGIGIRFLAKTIKESARRLRQFIVLDCCFAASASSFFQSAGKDVVKKQTLDAFEETPKRGAALLCSSAAGLPSVIPEGAERTMFTGALLHVLENGGPDHGERLSLGEVHQLATTRLIEKHGDEAVRPEIHCPYQREGDLARIPLFPNPGCAAGFPGAALRGETENEKIFLDDLFDKFLLYGVILLFAQEGREHPGVHIRFMSRARDLFGPDNVLRVTPPHAPDLEPARYFSMLGEQCDAQRDITSDMAFESAIGDRIRKEGRLFLLVSRFERGNESCGKKLAASLRSLSEQHGRKLTILICGGGTMADMYFCGGPFSLLNNAEVMNWPEIGVEDVLLLPPGARMRRDVAEEILDISGGHPRLIMESLKFFRPGQPFDANACFEALTIHPFLWRFFIHCRENSPGVDCRRLNEMLASEEVGPHEPYINNNLIRRLYWKNLLKRSPDGSRLIWRCRAIREAGKRVLATL